MQAHAEPGAHEIAVDEAFERLYRSYARDVYRYSLALLRNPTDAEDITQTTFLNAYRAYQRGEEPRRPKHWLITIAHNACRSRHLRAVRRPQEVPFEETIAAMPAPAEETPKLEELLEALGRLPFNQRAALVMRELEGRSYAEIAETLELSVAAVETLIFRARRTLRRDRSLLGALSSVQLPPSLGGLFGGGGGAGAVAGGGLAVGSGLLAKAALLVAAGVVAGAIGPVVGAKVTQHRTPAAMTLSPLTLRSSPGAQVVTSAVATRALRGPMVIVKRQGRTFVVTEGAVGVGAAVPFDRGIAVSSSTGAQAGPLTAAPVAEVAAVPAGASAAPAGASVASSLPSSGSVTQAVTTTAQTAAAPAKTATTQVTQAVETATTAAGALPVSTAPLPTSTVAAPSPPPLPVDTSPVTSALPPTPTITLPSLP